jgi:hypothetical protein
MYNFMYNFVVVEIDASFLRYGLELSERSDRRANCALVGANISAVNKRDHYRDARAHRRVFRISRSMAITSCWCSSSISPPGSASTRSRALTSCDRRVMVYARHQ